MLPTAEQRALYHSQGFVSLGPYLGSEDLERLREALDRLHRPEHPNPYGVLVNDLWRQHPLFAQHIASTALGQIACALMQAPRARLFQDNLVWKTPGAARIEWHQDYSYMPLSGPEGVTLWLALDDADPQNGCLHYMPGTHRLGERAPADFIRGTGQPQSSTLPAMDLQGRDPVALPVRAGELLAHHPLVWHMSPQNSSAGDRRALSVNWIAAELRWRPSHAPHPFNYALGPEEGAELEDVRFPVVEAMRGL